jgi:hypothetical protein
MIIIHIGTKHCWKEPNQNQHNFDGSHCLSLDKKKPKKNKRNPERKKGTFLSVNQNDNTIQGSWFGLSVTHVVDL